MTAKAWQTAGFVVQLEGGLSERMSHDLPGATLSSIKSLHVGKTPREQRKDPVRILPTEPVNVLGLFSGT